MKIYTKTGDDGSTGLFGGKRVMKSDLRVDSYGTVDELNAWLGVVNVECVWEEIIDIIFEIQLTLFDLGADLATPHHDKHEGKIERLSTDAIQKLEGWIDYYEAQLNPIKNFIMPGGSRMAAYFHYARTICRRAERKVTALSNVEQVNPNVLIYLNRLSDLLFVLARFSNSLDGVDDIPWRPRE